MSEPIITFEKVNKWYGNNFHVLRDIDLTSRGRAHRDLRALGLGQEHADPLHQRARGVPGGPLTVDGVELTDDVKASRRAQARSAWCSSSSTCSRTSRCWRT
jgi:general L-amino acid transport system ATP-binding protein